MIKNVTIRITAFVLAAILALSFTACANKYKFPDSTEEETRTVLTIGDHDVPYEQYRYFFMNYKHSSDNGDDAYWRNLDADEEFKRIDALVRDSLARIYATFDLALEYGIDYRSGDVQKAVTEKINEQIENDFGGADKYEESLKTAFLNNSVYRFLLAEFECEDRLYKALVDDGTIKTDNETIRAAINNPEIFCHAKQILIMNNNDDDPEENRQLAEDILMQVRLGADFDALVAKFGEDPEMITNPKGYYFTHGELLEEFEDAAFALEVDEVSDVVESYLGYHIILRCEVEDSYVTENYSDLGEAYLTSQYYLAVSDKMTSSPVVDNDISRSFTLSDFYYSKIAMD